MLFAKFKKFILPMCLFAIHTFVAAQEPMQLRDTALSAIGTLPHNCETVTLDYTTLSRRPNVAVYDNDRLIIVPTDTLDAADPRRNPMFEFHVDRYVDVRGGGWRTVDKISVSGSLAEPDELFLSDIVARVNEMPLFGSFDLPQTQDMGHEIVGVTAGRPGSNRRTRTVIPPEGIVTSFHVSRFPSESKITRSVSDYAPDDWNVAYPAVLDIRFRPLRSARPIPTFVNNDRVRWETEGDAIHAVLDRRDGDVTATSMLETFNKSSGLPRRFVRIWNGVMGETVPDVQTLSTSDTRYSGWMDVPGVGQVPRSIHRIITIEYDGKEYPFSDELTIINSISTDVDEAFFDIDAVLAANDFRGESATGRPIDPADSFLRVGAQ